MKGYPNGAVNYFRAVKEALSWTLHLPKKNNLWVAKKSGWDVNVVETMVGHNMNLSRSQSIEDIDLNLSAEQINSLEECVIFAKELAMIPKDFQLNKIFRPEYFRKGQCESSLDTA